MLSRLTPEQQLALLMTGLHQSPEGIKEIETLCNGTGVIDYQKLFEFASQNGVASMIYRNLQGLNCIPAAFMDRLKNAYYSVLRNNVVHLQETMKVSGALRENGIEVIILKGSLASEILFKDLGVYPTGDIDLLIRPSEIRKASAVLLGFGYKIVDEKIELEQSDYLNFFNGTYWIDVHCNLVAPYFNIPNDFWWLDSRKIVREEEELTILSAEKYLLFAVFHLFSHGFTTLKCFVLVEAVMAAYKEEIDWPKLIAYSEEYGMGSLVLFTLRLVHEAFGMEVPEQLIEIRLRGYRIFRRAVATGLFRKSSYFFVRIAFYLLLLAGPSALFRVTTRAVFPNPARMRSRYGLPEHSKLIYVYYVLNPILLAIRKDDG